MKNLTVGAFLSVTTLIILAGVVRAQITFPDSTVQTTAFKCLPAGTGTWSTPVALGATLAEGQPDALELDSAIDCSGTLHWVRTHYFAATRSELLYANSGGGGPVTLVDGGTWDFQNGDTTIQSPTITIDSDGNIYVIYLLLEEGSPSTATPYKIENLTP